MLDDDQRAALLLPARSPLQSALGPQPDSLQFTAAISRSEDDAKLHADFSSIAPVYSAISGRGRSSAREEEAQLWRTITDRVADAVNAAAETYNNRVRPVANFAERRHVASLCQTSPAQRDAVAFSELLDTPGALPAGCDGTSTTGILDGLLRPA